MRNAHIALLSAPYHTQVNPTLSIVAVLVKRGHRVTYVTSHEFSSKVFQVGAEVLCYTDNTEGCVSWPTDAARLTLSLMLPLCEENRTDLLVYHPHALAGLVLAERLGAPAVRMTPALTYDGETLSHPIVPPAFREDRDSLKKREDVFLLGQGIDRSKAAYAKCTPTIYFYPKELRLSKETCDRDIYAARCAAEQPGSGAWGRANRDQRRTVLVSASTTFDPGPHYYGRFAEIFSDEGWNVVFATGSNHNSGSFGVLPPHCVIVQDVPLVAMMAHSDVLICGGGMSTTMEAMYHGLPMVMITHGNPELEMYAENVQRLGVGIHLERARATPENIRRSVIQVMEGSVIRDRVNWMQGVVRSSPGAEEASNWIENHLMC